MTCQKCTDKLGGMAFECIKCCVRWLSGMTPAAMAVNAPVIRFVMGEEFLNKVRQAWVKNGSVNAKEKTQ